MEDDLLRYEEFWDEPTPTNRRLADLAALQGAWLSGRGPRQAEFLIAGNYLTAHFVDGTIYMGTFTLGNYGALGTMNVRIDEGPAHHKDQVALCIFAVSEDTLRWCTSLPGSLDRPSSFQESEPLTLALEFHREHSQQRQQILMDSRSHS